MLIFLLGHIQDIHDTGEDICPQFALVLQIQSGFTVDMSEHWNEKVNTHTILMAIFQLNFGCLLDS